MGDDQAPLGAEGDGPGLIGGDARVGLADGAEPGGGHGEELGEVRGGHGQGTDEMQRGRLDHGLVGHRVLPGVVHQGQVVGLGGQRSPASTSGAACGSSPPPPARPPWASETGLTHALGQEREPWRPAGSVAAKASIPPPKPPSPASSAPHVHVTLADARRHIADARLDPATAAQWMPAPPGWAEQGAPAPDHYLWSALKAARGRTSRDDPASIPRPGRIALCCSAPPCPADQRFYGRGGTRRHQENGP